MRAPKGTSSRALGIAGQVENYFTFFRITPRPGMGCLPVTLLKDRLSIYESVLQNPTSDLPDDELRFGKGGM
jgi:hypothetical protein